MSALKSSIWGFAICSFLCLCFFQVNLSAKTFGKIPVKLCAEDTLVLLHYMNLSSCNMISMEHDYIVLPNTTQDGTKCMITCKITADVRTVSWEYYVGIQDQPELPTERKDGYFYIAKRYSCQYYSHKQQKTADLTGYCDYNNYKKANLSVGEKCNADEQCYSSKCLMNECSCADRHTWYHAQCVRDDMLQNGAFYGDQCLFSEQCTFPGGVCSENKRCFCRSGFDYNVERKSCYEGTMIKQ
ncbi:uncharacterized protein LOC134234012 isoform X2 [Saccostrea cucullata]|uniref:uncharacterized protein LOC134234012 isoform X2 n=1 Tax=Saccostrea cuccullata TaxID=36930 RepID=UPI002ED3DD7B